LQLVGWREEAAAMSPTVVATLVELAQVAIALGCSYVLISVLKSAAVIKQKGIQLGGAAAIFVVVLVLLNRYLPSIQAGLVQEATAAPQPVVVGNKSGDNQALSVDVALSPATQLVTARELSALDRNKFVVDDGLQVAVQKPIGGTWQTGPTDSFATISLLDVPQMSASANLIGSMMFDSSLKEKIFGVWRAAGTEITIEADSEVNALPFAFNMFDDPAFVKMAVRSQPQFMRNFGLSAAGDDNKIDDAKLDKIATVLGPQIAKATGDSIKAKFPIKKMIFDGVFVTFVDADMLGGKGMIVKLQPASTLLDRAMMWGLRGYTVKNLYVNQDLKVASYNTGVDLSGVLINGHKGDIRINNVGFIVTGPQRAILVNLIYLSTDGIEIFQQLQNEFNSLRFTG
jgi:hypothetical protein